MLQLNCSSTALASCSSQCSCGLIDEAVPQVDYQANVAIAFLCVTGAGLSTTFGAALVFCNRCVTRTNHKILGASLGFASGVMLYVSFVEILQKAFGSFVECKCLWSGQSNDDAAYTASTLCFFAGVLLVFILDLIVHALSSHDHGHSHGPEAFAKDVPQDENGDRESKPLNQPGAISSASKFSKPNMDDFAIEDDSSGDDDRANEAMRDPEQFLDRTLSRHMIEADRAPHLAEGAVFDLERQMSRRMQDAEREEDLTTNRILLQHSSSGIAPDQRTEGMDDMLEGPGTNLHDNHSQNPSIHHGHSHGVIDDSEAVKLKFEQREAKRLQHMGMMTALAIGLHNFPEGLATFVATLANPKVGGALAVAIAIHNIPEGLCVSVPIYYATGSRWKGFWVAFFSGITEIIGAALGYGFLMAVMGPAAYAVLFGIVSGMMVTIVVKELLPTAHRYDPQDRVVTYCIFIGMAIMALSLIVFRI